MACVYMVEHYGPDGSPDVDPEQHGPYPDIDTARRKIRHLMRCEGFGTWKPDENFPAGGVEGWQESLGEGCGGWMIYAAQDEGV